LRAAKIAAWSGVRAVVAAAHRDRVLADAVAGVPGVGTTVLPQDRRLPARKLWIAFAVGSMGSLTVDDGARRALVEANRSLLAAGVSAVDGVFDVQDAVEVRDATGAVFAKGLVRLPSREIAAGARDQLVVHRDDLVVLP
ncbi:MAG: glutamate 5-kinase, partial [Acidimicrobiales bacterium]|nr:glutamate 5-kinase [Acidimicrobiales bacterium]